IIKTAERRRPRGVAGAMISSGAAEPAAPRAIARRAAVARAAADIMNLAVTGEHSDAVIATLLRLGIIGKDDWDVGLQQALEVTCDLLDVDRASYWSFRDDPSVIVCDLGYARSKKLLERGMVIHEANCPGYFAKIRTVQVLAVEDARAEPEIRALGAYLNTHEIRALLDVPVFSQGRLAGILC